jgi:hypothetical protein
MDKEQLIIYLKSIKRSNAAINRAIWALETFEQWLNESQGLTIDSEIDDDQLEDFIASRKNKQKNLLLGLINVFDFQGRDKMKTAATQLRSSLLKEEIKPMRLKDFIRVNEDLIIGLQNLGIQDAWQLLHACRTPSERLKLASRLGVPYHSLLDLVKMADLSRIFAVKAVRTRLYLDSGYDTLDKLAAMDPMELHLALAKFVEENHFNGIPTTPKEAEFTVKAARKTERWITFEAGESASTLRLK